MPSLLSLIIERGFERTGFITQNDALHEWNSGPIAIQALASTTVCQLLGHLLLQNLQL